MDHHQRNILTVWENINCYQRSLIMDVLCIRAWLEMTDISSILVTTSFIIITTLSKYFTPGYHWYITRNISNTAVREMRSVRKGQVLVPQLGWECNNFPDCKTVRYWNILLKTSDMKCISIWDLFHIYSGPDPNKPCVFPFLSDDVTISSCTTKDDTEVCI